MQSTHPPPKAKYFVTLNLAKSFQADLDAVHSQLDPVAVVRIPSHITLIPPFSCLQPKSIVRNHIEVSTAHFKPFFIMPQGVDEGFPNREVIALQLAPAAYVERIAKHLALQLRPLMQIDGRSKVNTMLNRRFRPHITLARSKLVNDRNAAIDLLNNKFINRPAWADGVMLWKLDDSVWLPCQHICFPK